MPGKSGREDPRPLGLGERIKLSVGTVADRIPTRRPPENCPFF